MSLVNTTTTQSRSMPSSGHSVQRPNVFMMTNTLETGGSERQFVTLAHGLSPQAVRLHLGCLKRKGPLLDEVKDIAEFDVGGSFFNLQAQGARIALARHLRRNNITLAHAFDFYSNLMLIPTARLARIPVVIGSQRQIGDLLSPHQARAQAAVFRWCDKVVCNSYAAAEGLVVRGFSDQRIAVIPNALPAESFADAVPALPRIPGVIRVGLIARMNHTVKNHAGLLRVAARLAGKFARVEYLLVGDGPLRGSLEALAEGLGVRDSVRFVGDRFDIPALLQAIDVSVLTSSSESLSNSILESMAAGKPVVAYRVGGNPELVRHGQTGLLVSADDEEGFAEALGFLLSQPRAREAWGRRGREFALKHFSLERVRAQYEELYSSLLAGKGLRARSEFRVASQAKTSTGALRVAIVAPTPRWIGGHSVQAQLLLDHWTNDGRVRASLIPIDPPFPRLLSWLERIRYLRTVIRTPLYLAALWRGMKDVEVAHIFSASYWSFLLAPAPAWLVARLQGKEVLINYHSGEARDHLARWRTARAILRRVDRLVVPSAYLVNVFKDFGLKADVVPNFVDFKQFNYRPRQPLRPRLICTRGFHPYYSVDLVVRSFARVKGTFPAAKLSLAGKGPQETAIREYVRAEGLMGVDFTGPILHEQIHHLYDEADIFINASWVDNMPISILEAFASGTPVVTTAPEGIRYLVEHERTGLLCAPGDWQGLAENVARLLRDPGLAWRLAGNAFEESRRYRWEAVREDWLRVYTSLRNPLAPDTTRMEMNPRQEVTALND